MWHRNSMHQIHVKSEVQTLRTESGSDSGLYLQHIFKNQPWLLQKSGETARNLHVLETYMCITQSGWNEANQIRYSKPKENMPTMIPNFDLI